VNEDGGGLLCIIDGFLYCEDGVLLTNEWGLLLLGLKLPLPELKLLDLAFFLGAFF
jgi:hypothetical protein